MKDWHQYAKSIREGGEVTGSKPPCAREYFFIKLTDNLLPMCVLVLTILFACAGLFFMSSADEQKINWALHAAELSLGVFLGLLKTSKSL